MFCPSHPPANSATINERYPPYLQRHCLPPAAAMVLLEFKYLPKSCNEGNKRAIKRNRLSDGKERDCRLSRLRSLPVFSGCFGGGLLWRDLSAGAASLLFYATMPHPRPPPTHPPRILPRAGNTRLFQEIVSTRERGAEREAGRRDAVGFRAGSPRASARCFMRRPATSKATLSDVYSVETPLMKFFKTVVGRNVDLGGA